MGRCVWSCQEMEQHIYKRRSDGIYVINLKRTGRSCCFQLRLLLLLRTLLMSVSLLWEHRPTPEETEEEDVTKEEFQGEWMARLLPRGGRLVC
ncbi:hypothetical protein A6R68_19205, partial [Neotoma lepida]